MKGDVERHLDPAFPPLDCLVDMDLISLLRHVSIEGLGASHIDPLAIQNLGVVASEVRIPPPKFLDLHSLGFPHDGVVRHRPDLYVSAVICLSDSSVGDIRYTARQSVGSQATLESQRGPSKARPGHFPSFATKDRRDREPFPSRWPA